MSQKNYIAGGHQIGLFAKLELRRYFLRTHHKSEPITVLDCCMGEGDIWARLRSEFKVQSYWGVDSDKTQKKPGRLTLDSKRILQQPGLTQTVYDIDTYGSPWKHWLALLANGPETMTVFLTAGRSQMGGGWDTALIDTLGLRFNHLTLPDGLAAKVCCSYGVDACLGRAILSGYKVLDFKEAIPERTFKVEIGHGRKARYFGIRIKRSAHTKGGRPPQPRG